VRTPWAGSIGVSTSSGRSAPVKSTRSAWRPST
jgi:hypothetical protein